jgi:hypothetical protein
VFVKDVSAKMGDGRAHFRVAVRLPLENRTLCGALGGLRPHF